MQPAKTTSIIIFVITLLTACTSDNSSTVIIADTNIDSIDISTNIEAEFITYDNTLDNDSVNVAIKVTQPINDIFELNVDFKIYGGGWILSPLELDYPYGITKISFDKNQYLKVVDSIVETPKSDYKKDNNHDKPFKVVTQNTIFTQKVELLSTDNFEVAGEVFFIHEPICTPNKITFNIVQISGKITIEQMKYEYGTKKLLN